MRELDPAFIKLIKCIEKALPEYDFILINNIQYNVYRKSDISTNTKNGDKTWKYWTFCVICGNQTEPPYEIRDFDASHDLYSPDSLEELICDIMMADYLNGVAIFNLLLK